MKINASAADSVPQKCEFDAIHLSRDLPEASRMRTAEDKLKGILPYAAKRAIKIKLKKKS